VAPLNIVHVLLSSNALGQYLDECGGIDYIFCCDQQPPKPIGMVFKLKSPFSQELGLGCHHTDHGPVLPRVKDVLPFQSALQKQG
jgi:hypothetical protein